MGLRRGQKVDIAAKEAKDLAIGTENKTLAEGEAIEPEISPESRAKIMRARIGGIDEEFGLARDRMRRHQASIGSTLGGAEFELEAGREAEREKGRGAAETEEFFVQDAMRRRLARAGVFGGVAAARGGRFGQFQSDANRHKAFDWAGLIGAGATAAGAYYGAKGG